MFLCQYCIENGQIKSLAAVFTSTCEEKGANIVKEAMLKTLVIANRVDIDQRPAIVEEKSRFGDFEVVNDRASGFFKMKKVPNRTAELVKEAVIESFTEALGANENINGLVRQLETIPTVR